MRDYRRCLRALVSHLREIKNSGSMEPGQMEEVIKAVRELKHSLAVQDKARIAKAVDRLARAFVRFDGR